MQILTVGPWTPHWAGLEHSLHSMAQGNGGMTIRGGEENVFFLQVGPIAVTSANPTGEADTTHHNQVYAKLGNKVRGMFVMKGAFFNVNSSCIVLGQVDGVLCDGASPENIASTVVDCTKIDTGHIGFFRVGLIPKSKVINTLCHICSC